jgi:Uma2 family endonuclease
MVSFDVKPQAQTQTTDMALSMDVSGLGLSDGQFYQLCRDNRELRFELTAQGELIVMGPTSSDTGRRNARLNQRLANWSEQDSTGECFDSSAGFTLPNGAKVSPDASWVRKERYAALTQEERDGFAPLCPDFVVELRSKSDRLQPLQAKMQEYIAQGARLGWLIDPVTKTVYVYRPQQEVETLRTPQTLTGDTVLPGFTLRLDEIW